MVQFLDGMDGANDDVLFHEQRLRQSQEVIQE